MAALNILAVCLGFVGTLVLAFIGVPPVVYNRSGTISMLPPHAPKDADGTNRTYIRRMYYVYTYGFRFGVGLVSLAFLIQGWVTWTQM